MMTAASEATPLIVVIGRAQGTLGAADNILRRRHHDIQRVASGGEALLVIRRERPRLVVFDFDLGDMTAPELCRAVRQDEHTRETSLLFIADRSEETQVDLCMAAGCNDIAFRADQPGDLDGKIERLTAIATRRELRTITKLEVNLDRNGYYILGHSLNVSANGMLVETDNVLPAQARLRVQFYLSGEPAPLRIRSEIVRAEFNGPVPRYGLSFVDASSEERERISNYVRRNLARQLH
jgi:CheY-like chemotaxis protein